MFIKKDGVEIDDKRQIRRDPDTGSLLYIKNGFYILHLYGNPYERGYAHGKLLKSEIHDSKIAEYYGTMLEKLYKSSDVYLKIPRPFKRTVEDILEWFFYTPLEKLFMEETRDELYGIADAVGFDREVALRGVSAPDLMEFLAASFLKGGKESLGNYYLGGCSGLYLRRSAISKKAFAMFARNMDFPGAMAWKYPALIFSYPDEMVDVYTKVDEGKFLWKKKNKQRYLYVSAAGFPGFGLTGYNESGIALGAFMCLSSNLSKKLPLMLDYNHYLFTRTESIDGIKSLIQKENLRSASPHTVLFADKDKAVAVEVDSKRAVFREVEEDFDMLPQTNHFIAPIMKKKEFEFPLERENTIGRYRLLTSAVEDNYGEINIKRMIDIISSNLNLSSRTTHILGGDFPSQIITLTSVVFEMATGNFWVAGGKPPGVCYNPYFGFNFYDEINEQRSRRLPVYKRSSRPVVRETIFKRVTEKMKKSMWYITISQEHLKMGRTKDAINNINRARRLHDDPGYRYILGILLIKDEKYFEAIKIFEDLRKEFIFPPVKMSAMLLWEARAYDLAGNRDKALEFYNTGLKDSTLVRHMRKAFLKGIKRPYTKDKLPKSIDYYQLGPLEFI